MSVDQIKQGIASLSQAEQNEVTAYLFQLRHASDPDYQQRVASRLDDRNPANWLTPEEFERRLDAK